jgi:ABC-type transport system substrate-binding protein
VTRLLSRRRNQVLLLLAALSATLIFMLGCGEDSTTTAIVPGVTPTTTATAAPATPTPTTAPKVPVASRLKVVIPTPSRQFTLDYIMGQSSRTIMPMYDYLVAHDPKTGAEIPQLANSWSIEADGKSYTWKLKENIPFYKQGEPTQYKMTSKDVVHTFNIVSGIKSKKIFTSRPEFGKTVDATIVNNSEVQVKMAVVALDMAYLLSDVWPHGITSSDHWDAVGEEGYEADPIGTGPFTFLELKQNEYSLVQRVENHWRKTPEFHEVQFMFSAEAATRLAMLLAREVHMGSVPRLLHSQASQQGLKIVRSTQPGAYMHINIHWYKPDNYDGPEVALRTDVPKGPTKAYDPNDPLRRIEIREALNIAIDRNAINDTFYNGMAFPNVDPPFPPWRDDWKDEWAPYPGPTGKTGKEGGWPYPYDLEKAKKLVIDAGYPNGVDVNLYAANNQTINAEQADVAEALVTMWAKAGIRVKLTALPITEVINTWRNRDKPASMYMTSETATDPLCVILSFGWYESGIGKWDYQEISDFKHKCDATPNLDERRKLAQEFGDWWRNNFITIPLMFVFDYAVIDPEIVADYEVNMEKVGPTRYLEFATPVYK